MIGNKRRFKVGNKNVSSCKLWNKNASRLQVNQAFIKNSLESLAPNRNYHINNATKAGHKKHDDSRQSNQCYKLSNISSHTCYLQHILKLFWFASYESRIQVHFFERPKSINFLNWLFRMVIIFQENYSFFSIAMWVIRSLSRSIYQLGVTDLMAAFFARFVPFKFWIKQKKAIINNNNKIMLLSV